MLRSARKYDRNIWIKLNGEFMDHEVTEAELGNVFDKALKSNDHIKLFMIEEEDRIVGFVNIMAVFSVWAKGFAVIVDDLYIIEESRRKGYGTKAMREIENYAREHNYKRMQFTSDDTEKRAKEFYKKLGFETAETNFYVRYI